MAAGAVLRDWRNALDEKVPAGVQPDLSMPTSTSWNRKRLTITTVIAVVLASAAVYVTDPWGLFGDHISAAAKRSTDLRGFVAPGTSWRHAPLDGYDLSDADLSGSDLKFASFAGSTMIGTNLRGSYLTISDMIGVNADRCRLDGAWMRHSRLNGASFRGASLRGANLKNVHAFGTDFRDADLTDATLAIAILFGADFRGANLSGTDFTGAFFDDRTKWPVGFDPWAAGADLTDTILPHEYEWLGPGKGQR